MTKKIIISVVVLTIGLASGCKAENSPQAKEPNDSPSVSPNDANEQIINSSQPVVSAVEPNESSANRFHDKCARILSVYVKENGCVDYTALKRKKLELFLMLTEFDNLDRDIYNSWSEKDKIAFWINAYNIKMLHIIVENYPIQSSRIFRLIWPPDSIRHIRGIWTDYKMIVMDEEFTLEAIDRNILRKQFNDPRIFLALTQASIGGPPLQNEPYRGDTLDAQLDDQVKKFLASSQGFSIDTANKIVYTSALFDPTWYGAEFVKKYSIDRKFKDHTPVDRAVLNFISNYIPPETVQFLELENYQVKRVPYDWRINDK